MKLKSGLAFIIAAIAFGAQARDMNSIQQSGELKVGVPEITRRWRFTIKPESWGYDVDMAKDLGKRLG
jgi:cyclohexadienyl dehydratase